MIIIRHPNEMLRTEPTGFSAVTGRQGRDMFSEAGDRAEASVFSSRSGQAARKFNGCPDRPNSHVILTAGHAAARQAITEELHAVPPHGLFPSYNFTGWRLCGLSDAQDLPLPLPPRLRRFPSLCRRATGG